jgi:hypothetical protein
VKALLRALLIALLLLAPATAAPQEVLVGIYLQNVNDIDMKASLFTLDFYVWFRWKGDIDPSTSFEFTNVVEKWGMTRDAIYPQPVDLPDGGKYQCFHVQGKFNRKFDLRAYPLDDQELPIEVEDSRHLANEIAYVADTTNCGFSNAIAIPGWEISRGTAQAGVLAYPTTFGRPQAPGKEERYARFTYALSIYRPWGPYLVRMLLPLIVILLSSFVPLYLAASYADARIGISITSLLSTVALHLTVSSDLPHVGYIRLIDKVYNLAYVIIFATLVETVIAIKMHDGGQTERAHALDRTTRRVLLALSAAGIGLMIALR